MTGQLKQRIVGICVLVFLALIILPWLFGSNQSVVFEDKNKKQKTSAADLPELVKESPENAQPIPDKIATTDSIASTQRVSVEPQKAADSNPVYSLTQMEDTKPVRKSQMMTSNTDSAKKPMAEKNKPGDSARLTEVNASKLSKIENAIVHTQPDLQPEAAKPIKSKSPELALKKPNLENIQLKTNTKKPVAKAIEKNWTIQLGSFSNTVNAGKLVKDLKAKGYPAYSKTSKDAHGSSITRVFVGPEAQRQTAEGTIKKIEKSFKLHGVIVKMSV